MIMIRRRYTTHITWRARATEVAHKVMAGGPILTRVGLTVIHI
jgi:hypothetical protein